MKKGTPVVIGICIFLLIISSFTLTGSSFVPGASFGVAYTGPLTGTAQEELDKVSHTPASPFSSLSLRLSRW